MAPYLQAEGISKAYSDRQLFADVSLSVSRSDKVAIVAANGSGKSTLLRVLTGMETPDTGSVITSSGLRIGFLTQNPDFDPDMSVMRHVARNAPADDWGFEDRARAMLGRLGIHDTAQLMGQVSGGMAKRIALAEVLLEEPDMLILDEPTNHLDIDMTEWLEGYLSRSACTLLMVTHDRYFLDRVCTRIIELDRGRAYTYDGNFDYYLEKKQEREAAFDAETARAKNLFRKELDWMRRQPQARGSKARYRIDSFHELERRAGERHEVRSATLTGHGSYIGSKIFEARGITKAYGSKRIINDWSYDFARYDRVGIVGANGVGKSTFIKMLQGIVTPDSGKFDIGQTVRFGYYSQEGMDFRPDQTVLEAVTDIAEHIRIDDKTVMSASQFLNLFLFPPSDQRKPIAKLSGGERRRLYLATVLMRNPNFLILDEPTNDLDIMTLSVLEEYLSNFKGCIIVISHDRFFLDRVVNHLFVFEGDGVVTDFPGDYSTYRHCVTQRAAEEARQAESMRRTSSKPERKQPRREASVRLTYKERKEMEELSALLPSLEEEREKLVAEMSKGTLSADALMETSERTRILSERIDEAELRLLELMEKEG